jgi:predicted nuclease of predicted toxin-antitoxin system
LILADENIDDRIIASIRNKGIAVYSVKESSRGISDESVISLSQNPARIILTEDKDFGEWVYAHQRTDISVILLRYHYQDTFLMIEILLQVLESKKEELFGKYTTITTDKVRIRSLK